MIARRSGADWYVGAMTEREPRTFRLPLKLLGPGRYAAELWIDAKAKHGLSRRTAMVLAADELPVDVATAGGAYLRFRRGGDKETRRQGDKETRRH